MPDATISVLTFIETEVPVVSEALAEVALICFVCCEEYATDKEGSQVYMAKDTVYKHGRCLANDPQVSATGTVEVGGEKSSTQGGSGPSSHRLSQYVGSP